jgi:hypothetical protein
LLSPEAYYRIDRISNVTGGLRYDVTYMTGSTGPIGNTSGNIFTFRGYDYSTNTYPLVKDLQGITSKLNAWEAGVNKNVESVGLFVTKISGDLGSVRISLSLRMLENISESRSLDISLELLL